MNSKSVIIVENPVKKVVVVDNKRGPQGGITVEAREILQELNVILNTLRTFSAAAFDVPHDEWPAAIYDPEHNVIMFGVPRGEPGPQGPTGPQGTQGVQGVQGSRGDKGDKGDAGDTGPPGEQGPQGIQGAVGPPGVQGEEGPPGSAGAQGPAGPTGATGNKGDKGDPGPPGAPPVTGHIDCGGAYQTHVSIIDAGRASDFTEDADDGGNPLEE
jgi:hypothetical protein